MAFESGAGTYMQGGSYAPAQARRATYFWAARTSANTPGLLAGGLGSATDMQLSAAASGLVVDISEGECLIPGTEATSQGGYGAFYSSAGSVTLATANASNPRIDLICATAADPEYTIPSGGTSGYITIQAVTGTPTAGATLSNLSGAPSLPGSSLLLGYVLVPAAATNLTSADIANKATMVGPPLGVARGSGSQGAGTGATVTITVNHGLSGTPTYWKFSISGGTTAIEVTNGGSATPTQITSTFAAVTFPGVGAAVTQADFANQTLTYEWIALL